MLKADLHIHTTLSDGMLSPEKLIELALDTDLDVIAITDHDTSEAVSRARTAALETPLEVLRGVEISTRYENKELHLLAYGYEENDMIRHLFSGQKKRRTKRAEMMISRLNGMGFDISMDEVIGESGAGLPGRPHIARVLIRKGYAATMQEVFFRYLGDRSPICQQIDYPDTEEAIRMVHSAGGLAVLAHPAGSVNMITLGKLCQSGLDGVECYHPSHNSTHQRKYLQFCDNYGLLVTGGSDFHGSTADYYRFGKTHIMLEDTSPLLQYTSRIQKQTVQH